EIGGTVGDIESIPFLEVARQMIHEQGRKNAISVHLTLIPEVTGGELKTKPTQHSVKTMLETGIQPDILICRSPVMLDESTCRKIALFTNVDLDAVFTSPNIDTTIYQIPIVFFDQKLDEVILRKMEVECRHADMHPWHSVMEGFSRRKSKVKIGIVGKYMETHDTYTSLYEALFHASIECGIEAELIKIDSSVLEEENSQIESVLGHIDGILVPGGMVSNTDPGKRGINGMVKAAAWARTNKKPFLGICLGMHVMLIDWARNVLNWSDADSAEFNPDTKYPVVSLEEQIDNRSNGRTMRLGAGKMINNDNTHIMAAYGEKRIVERHRSRYVFTNKYREEMANSGLNLAAFTPDNALVECIEWPLSGENAHPWGVSVQFHPEYKSKPTAASPLFREFIKRCGK
ncbi:MAG: CTP synthase, partial [Treponema sp.]|nr:CTP synthase [Treponema sp.]